MADVITAAELIEYLSKLHSTAHCELAAERMKTMFAVEVDIEKYASSDLLDWLECNVGASYTQCYRSTGGDNNLRNWTMAYKKEMKWPWSGVPPKTYHVAKFTDEKDAMMFALRFQ